MKMETNKNKTKDWLLIEFDDEIRNFTRWETKEEAQHYMRHIIFSSVGSKRFLKAYMKNGEPYEVDAWGLDEDKAWIQDCDTLNGLCFRNWQIINIGERQ